VGAAADAGPTDGMNVTIIKDLRAAFGPARDQTPRPTCMAFAASDAHAAARPGWIPLSVEWAYFYSLKRDGGVPHEGTTVEAMLATLQYDGQPEESNWPYTAKLFANTTKWKPPASVGRLFHRKSELRVATVASIFTQLDANEPVLLTMSISPAFYNPRSGIVSSNEPLMPNRVHAVVAVGHGRGGNDRFVLVRNSWGEAWGIKGYVWLGVDYLSPRLLDAAAMTEEP
jgi:C1A family cysteine protease